MLPRYSFLHKFVTLLLAGATLSACIMMVFLNLMRPPEKILYIISIVPLLLPLFYIVIWQRQEKNNPEKSAPIQAFWTGIISYCLAFDIVSFGWKKVFGLQFRPIHLSIADIPMAEQAPDWLMWHFFGYSKTFGLLVAGLQITGAFLLLFQRTRLLGALVLLPVMVNILLINFFYRLGIGPLYQSIVLAVGLAYLVYLHYATLKEALLSAKDNLPVFSFGNNKIKNVSRLVIMVLAFGYIYIYHLKAEANPESELFGVYDVKSYTINKKPITGSFQDSVLNRVYFDDGNACILQYNHHKRRLFGHYTYDAAKHSFQSIFDFKSDPAGEYMPRGKSDTLQAFVTKSNLGANLIIAGIMGKDSVQMELLKVR